MSGCTQAPPGSDRDSHGCIPSAGYTWCEEKQKCLRPWEENCTVMPGSDRDAHGCIPSAGYTWCDAKQSCVREWEDPCLAGAKNLTWALAIAESSACVQEGNLTDQYAYNNNTRTWWLGLDIIRAGCAPACVVYEENGSAEINWRCTGLIPLYTVKTANVTSLGEILTDGNGMTLYVFLQDSANRSNCAGTCAATWPPLLVTDTITIPAGLPGNMGAILRSDNTTQVTYNSMPLYRYSADRAPGDANGQGFNAKWYVVTPDMETFPSPP